MAYAHTKTMLNIPRYLIIHHCGGTDLNPLADTSNQTFEVVDNYHRSLGWGGCGYHYYIDKTGKVTQGRQDAQEGCHCNQVENGKSMNVQSLGICLAGNFDLTFPTPEQEAALTKLLKEKMAQYKLLPNDIKPHRHWANKTCYGRRLTDDWARNLVKPIVEAPNPQLATCMSQVEAQKVEIGKMKGFWKGLLEYIKANQ
jgi:N-acetylmuramoyl-L-alanine amidase